MIHFESDYVHGAHPRVLQALIDTNFVATSGYTTDLYCMQAAERIRQLCQNDQVDVQFLVGGTQTNTIVIDALLASYQGVIAVETGHIVTHEAGAIEKSGHKVLMLPHHCGKMDAQELKQYLERFYGNATRDHMAYPGMVYLSHPTEYGTLYTAEELRAIQAICRQYEIPLFVDGARLLYGMASEGTDVDLPLLAKVCDVFYIGGTKAGTLCGEAVVFCRQNKPSHFMTIVKQHGALLAKGRLLGVQFNALFQDDLWQDIGRHALKQAKRLKQLLTNAPFEWYMKTDTNQQFVIIENNVMERLAQEVGFSVWESYDDDHTVVRFATSWSTTDEDLYQLEAVLKYLND